MLFGRKLRINDPPQVGGLVLQTVTDNWNIFYAEKNGDFAKNLLQECFIFNVFQAQNNISGSAKKDKGTENFRQMNWKQKKSDYFKVDKINIKLGMAWKLNIFS